MKKFLLTSCAILSAIGVQAQTTFTEGGVTYDATLTGSIPVVHADTTKELNTAIVNSDGSIIYSLDIHTITTTKNYYDAKAVNIDNSATSVNIYTFDRNTTGVKTYKSGNLANPESYYDAGSQEYAEYFESIGAATLAANNIKNYTDMSAEANVDAYIYWSYKPRTGNWSDEETTDVNDVNLNRDAYYQKYINNNNEVLYFMIRTIGVAKRYYTTDHQKDSCVVTTIDGAAANHTNIRTISIGKDVTTIVKESFKGASQLSSFSVQNGGNFVYQNGILYTSDMKNIVAASCDVQSQYIPESVTTIYDGAFYNTVNDITISSMKIGVNTGNNQGSKVEFITPSEDLEVYEEYNGGYYVVGNVTQDNFDKVFTTYSSATYLDFTSANIMENIDINNQTNTLYFFETTYNISGNNVINNNICQALVIKDSERTKKFYSPYSFTASSASYDREFDNYWSTLCLPFNVKSTVISGKLLCGELKAYNDSRGLFTFLYSTSINANTPYIVKTAVANETLTIQAYNVQVEATTETEARFGHASFICCFDPKNITSDSNYSYFGIKRGTDASGNPNSNMVKLNGAKVNAFRAYLKAPTSEINTSSAAKIRFVDAMDNEIETIELPYTTGIEEVNTENVSNAIYDLNGLKQNEAKKGLNIVNGKLVINK